MSTDEKDTTFTVLEGGAETGDSPTESAGDAFVKPTDTVKESNDKIEITAEELEALGGLLETFKNLLLGHEIRLGNSEHIIAKLVEHTNLPIPKMVAVDPDESADAASNVGLAESEPSTEGAEVDS